MESPTPGLIAQMKGFLTKQRYRAATVFVDNYSGLTYIHLQQGTGMQETLSAKVAFEKYAKNHGIKVRHYHADNGRFEEKTFRQAVASDKQTISFCGAYAHHQNGIAEKKIRDLQDYARTMMIHAKSSWPEAIDDQLWPYALRMAANSMNCTPPLKCLETPMERFSQIFIKPSLKNIHTFGCPVYALTTKLQSTGTQNKWLPRARVGIYLGPSLIHAKSVGLILNAQTGRVSPMFHVKYDDFFETTRGGQKDVFSKITWQQATGFKLNKQMTVQSVMEIRGARVPNETQMELPTQESGEPNTDESGHIDESGQEARAANPGQDGNPNMELKRSTRTRHPPERLGFASVLEGEEYEAISFTTQLNDEDLSDFTAENMMNNPLNLLHEIETKERTDISLASSAHKGDPDVMYYHEAMAAPDRKEFVQAAKAELESHFTRKHWKLQKKKTLPKGTKLLPTVWAMRRKRRILTGEIYKYKARLNVHGGKQVHGENYWETHSPVVTWTSIRIGLILSLIHGWFAYQVDFVSAFPQADVECVMYLEIPKGYQVPNGNNDEYCLELVKNLYGQKQAGRVWNKHLHSHLLKRGFVQSEIDPCVYTKGKMIFLVYVDDGILLHPDAKAIEKEIQAMSDVLEMTSETSVADYIGVNVAYLEGGKKIELTQPKLIDQILIDLGLDESSTSKDTPSLKTRILHNGDQREFKEPWDYRSVVGKLNFLEKSTRPDIAYAVHQCARFQADPKQSHGEAVKRIGRYLLGTRKKGLIYSPNTTMSFECYCDADFSGNWNQATAEEDVTTAKSRTGYVVMYAGCPVIWGSKLQSVVALSTTEAELVALSTALRDVIPAMDFLEELKEKGILEKVTTPEIKCIAFEDNSGALEIANVHKMRPRTKHINIRYHHFRELIRKGQIIVKAISTTDQLGDILTKQPELHLFKSLRESIMGW